jgi:hypothetical protein
MVRPVTDPAKPGITVEASRWRYSETLLSGRWRRVKIAHLLAAVGPAGVDLLARRLDQPSNRRIPRGTGVSDPGAVPHN